jgi:hypothetical protein
MAQARVPWREVLDVINEIQPCFNLLLNYKGLVEQKDMPMPPDVAETLCGEPIKRIHASCTKALRVSNILSAD